MNIKALLLFDALREEADELEIDWNTIESADYRKSVKWSRFALYKENTR